MEAEEDRVESPQAQQQEEESVAVRLQRRRSELFKKRQLDSIREIEQELAGGQRASSVATGEEPSIGQKRAASTDLPHSSKRALAPPVYEGANLRELRDFLLGCEVYFDAVEEQEDRRRIVIAASYLRKEALRQWSRTTPKPTTWTAFEAVLRDMIQDPANRMSVATLKIKQAKQGEGQSVREFANYIEELEDDVPSLTEEQQRAWALLNGLRHEIRSTVLREEREIRSREQVIAAAQRLYELGRIDARSSQAYRRQGASSAPQGASNAPQTVSAERRTDGKKCYRCGREGHISRHCTQAEQAPRQ